MNNGICSIGSIIPYQTDYLSNYIPSNLVRYSQLELSIPQRLLGNSISIPSIYGLPINTNSRLDFENNLIYIVDTSVDPVAQTPASTAPYSIRSTLVQVPTTQVATRLIIDWGDGSVETYQSNPTIASHIYSSHGIYYIQISFPSIISNGGDYYPPVNSPLCNGRDGKIIGILSFGNKIRSFTFQFMVNVSVVPKNMPSQMTGINMSTGSIIGKNISLWNISNITTFNNFSFSGRFNEDVSSWTFNPSITSLASLFQGCQRFNNGDPYTESYSSTVPIPAFAAGNNLNKWDVSNITNMSNIFAGCWYFNQNLNNWNVNKVTNFTSAFGQGHNTFNSFDGDLTGWTLASSGVNCTSMFGIDIGATNRGRLFTGKGVDGWNTSGVTNMRNMFGGNTLFNINLSNFTTNNVTDMSYMFSACSSFVGSGLSGWNTSNVIDMNNMFINATSFNQPLNNWNVRKVTNFASMFQSATGFNSSLSGWQLGLDTAGTNSTSMFELTNFNQPINDWNTSKVTNMSRMFRANTVFNQSLDTWNTSLVNNMNAMFNLAFAFNQNIGTWNVGLVTDMNGMFGNALAFNNGGSSDINNWNTSNVTNMSSMFFNASSFNQPLNNWNVRKVTTFASMFQGATSFNSSLSGWALGADTAGTSCLSMFQSATSFNQDISNWDTSKVTNMGNMFANQSTGSGFNQNIGSWNTSSVTNMSLMFYANYFFNNNNNNSINSWNTANVTDMNLMFFSAISFNQPIGNWNVSKVTNMTSMFTSAFAFNQDISNWNLAGLNASARLDNFMNGKTGANSYSTANYDALLIGWNNNKLVGANGIANWRTDLKPNFGGAKYTAGGAAATARAALVSYGWTITDGGTA